MIGVQRLIAVALLVGALNATSAVAQSTPSMNLEGSGLISFDNPALCTATACNGDFSASVSGVIGQSVQNLNFILNFQVPLLPASANAGSAKSVPLTLRKRGKQKKPSVSQEIQDLQFEVDNLETEINALQSNASIVLVPGCFPAYGSGTSQDGIYGFAFVGQYCGPLLPLGIQILSGSITITTAQVGYYQPWAVGTLVATGLPKCCGGDFPNLSNGMITSIVGASGQEFEGP